VVDPPLAISSFGRSLWIEAYNERGEVLLALIAEDLKSVADITLGSLAARRLDLTINEPDRVFTEEERSKMPTVFTVLRAVTNLFHSEEDSNLGLYGAFGYDLAFQFDAIELKLSRPDDQRDMVLFLPDEILVVDHYAAKAWIDRYDFARENLSTEGKAAGHCSRAVPQRRQHPAARGSPPGRICRARRQGEGKLPSRRSFRSGAGAEILRALRKPPVRDFQPAEGDQSVALFLLHQSRQPGISRRCFAGDVRARFRPAHRDLPDLRYDQARRRSDRRQRADPEALELEEGRVRAHHVLGRRPQRQEPGLRAGLGQGDRPGVRSRCIRG
jgi:hypothetical protein